MEASPDVVAKTQKSLGKYVKKPALTEKLLKKPPFRFLHDVIKAVIKETGFLKGLFSEAELNGDNVKDKEAKVKFLAKLIEAVKTLAKTELKARPSKIVAGLECGETNVLLQTIAKCIDKKISSSDYVNNLTKTKDKPVKKRDSNKKATTPKSTDRAKESSRNKVKEDKNKKAEAEAPPALVEEIKPPDEILLQVKQDDSELGNTIQSEDDNPVAVATPEFSNARQPSAGLVRPKSARPKSGDRTRTQETPTLRPPSVRPSSARPGAPRRRPESALPNNEAVVMGSIKVIVENFDSGLGDDEDTVVIQNAPEVEDEVVCAGVNQGQLVEQILEKIQEEGVKKRVEIDWEQDGLRGKDATTKEVTLLRSYIQSLTKTANPLGKLLNYLHEDLEAMHGELRMWTNLKRQLYKDIDKQRKLTQEQNKPLGEKLHLLREELKQQEEEIGMLRNNVTKNHRRIKVLLDCD